ncbi:ABC transporter ATP-binding protein [Thermomonospora umbrina]|uniref:Peptide/nickel transport system ATP-binding protein n=1 Tax=Thermomonospora umbrina TaxID=111806 RepID=A0A3D9SMW1_9ACTN|nr:ABC transporter ATP-binding protein [Thermomonospora umbrina]REE95750.1 peptide/nickel transport system ATP-binding protein [Thermomonospora umbrina]
MSVLTLRDLTVDVPGRRVVDGLSLEVGAGRVVALVGPSGGGKSLTARSIVRLHGDGVRTGGRVLLDGTDVLALGPRELRAVRGRRIGYAFQDAAGSLNPTVTVGRHLAETVRAHAAGDPERLGAEALRRCGLDPGTLWSAYPFELSGGQVQRAALALATVLEPELLIADEVTTALDPVTQAAVLDAVRAQAVNEGRAVLLITHDLAVAGRWADEIAVLSEGRLVEHGPAAEVLQAPEAAFTRALVSASGTRREPPAAAPPGDPFRAVRRARRVLRGRARTTVALDGVDLDVGTGESVAVVGRSGSGKSTLVGLLAALDRPDEGAVLAADRDVWRLDGRSRRALRRETGLVFQDAAASFDPRYTVERVVAEALPKGDDRRRVAELLERVGLDPAMAARRPATLSGGERQRVALARALAARPRLLLADEPTTGLDVLAQERVLTLLDDLRREERLAVVFVTHDLRVARRVADRIVVLADGRIVEDLPAAALDTAAHPETRALLTASDPAATFPTFRS